MASRPPFPVLLRTVPLPVPPLSRIVCQVPMANQQKQKNGGRRNNSWHPYGLHFPDRSAVTVLLCASSCAERIESGEGRTNRVGERQEGAAK